MVACHSSSARKHVPLCFNQLFAEAGLDPADVRLLRHQTGLGRGRSLYEAWRTDRASFEEYQSIQLASKRASFARPYWAAFFGTWDGRTVFGGIYEVGAPQGIAEDVQVPLTGKIDLAGTVDRYFTRLTDLLAEYSGRLYIEWGGGSSGKRSWNKRADVQDKRISELYLSQTEEPFPGFMAIALPLSVIAEAPPGWIQRLSEAQGVYLLACPRNGELYVGSATAVGGFWARWQDYLRNGHGGNIALVDREPTDWRVSVLPVAGSANTTQDILAMEMIWKLKLQSRTFGLTRN